MGRAATGLKNVAAGITPTKETRRRAALLAWLWLSIKVAIMVAESIVMQITGFEIFEDRPALLIASH